MSISLLYLPLTIIRLIIAVDMRTLHSWSAFNDAWFGNFWVFLGPWSKAGAEPWVVALLEGRIRQGDICQTRDHPINGVVLEVGAGSGMWTNALADIARSSSSTTTKIYGVEPNPISAAALQRRVKDVGLEGRYEVVPVGIEDLEGKADIQPGSVDCIITVACLCSIPEPENNIRLLYEYLKAGGGWYVYEHVRVERGVILPLYQREFLSFASWMTHTDARQVLPTSSGSSVWDLATCVVRRETTSSRSEAGRRSTSRLAPIRCPTP